MKTFIIRKNAIKSISVIKTTYDINFSPDFVDSAPLDELSGRDGAR